MFHTQETRQGRLSAPMLCSRKDAWLGVGYYFWDDQEDAIRWGNDFKNRTGRFDIYEAAIDCANVLNTVFDENQYRFWLKQIEKIGKNWLIKTGKKIDLEQMNNYFRDRGVWKGIDGILFQDLPTNQDYLLVVNFFYRKKLQLVVYNKNIVLSFGHYQNYECTQ
jgi:hypothetical protein